MVPLCASRNYRHYSGNRPYSAYCRYWLFPSARSDFTGTIAVNRHYRGISTVTTNEYTDGDLAKNPSIARISRSVVICYASLLILQSGNTPYPAVNACYDTGGKFRLKHFLNDAVGFLTENRRDVILGLQYAFFFIPT